VEGAAVWSAGTACVTASSIGADLDLGSALAMAREMGAAGWAGALLLGAMLDGLSDAQMKSRAETAEPTPPSKNAAPPPMPL
jgi:hypothetical protein